jgi:threonine/homoserine/homoserine lactone efflux protein
MISTVLEGLLFGFVLSINIGPVFFLLIETSIKHGVKNAFIMNAGVITSDVLWIFLLYMGVDNYLESFFHSSSSQFIGGIIFIIFGIGGLFFVKNGNKVQTLGRQRGLLYTKGFVLNMLNPSVAIFWLATIAFMIKSLNNDRTQLMFFFLSVFCIVIFIDAFKFIMARKLKKFFNERRQNRLSKITNIIMVMFGMYLILFKSVSSL